MSKNTGQVMCFDPQLKQSPPHVERLESDMRFNSSPFVVVVAENDRMARGFIEVDLGGKVNDRNYIVITSKMDSQRLRMIIPGKVYLLNGWMRIEIEQWWFKRFKSLGAQFLEMDYDTRVLYTKDF